MPIILLPQNHAVAVAIMSYNGRVCFDLLADYDWMEDVEIVGAGIEESLAELEEPPQPCRCSSSSSSLSRSSSSG